MANPKSQYKMQKSPEAPQKKSPVEIANIMAGAAVKKLQMHKSYKDGIDPMEHPEDAAPSSGEHGTPKEQDGTHSPSYKKTGGPGKPSIDGSTHGDEDVRGGTESPTFKSRGKSKGKM